MKIRWLLIQAGILAAIAAVLAGALISGNDQSLTYHL